MGKKESARRQRNGRDSGEECDESEQTVKRRGEEKRGDEEAGKSRAMGVNRQ
ncbi:MAG: hypothetical protein LBQ79_09100 [Deltaproteobacteria bacterium]|jgi:hypothetical protein|nr:hypothetical protein [Deltaproteobacteria bacterium]